MGNVREGREGEGVLVVVICEQRFYSSFGSFLFLLISHYHPGWPGNPYVVQAALEL